MATDSRVLAEAVAVTVAVPVEQAWQRLQDFSVAHYYVPRLTDTQVVSAQRQGVGAHRRVYTGKRYLEETVLEWNPGQGFVIKLHKGSKPMPPFHRAEFEYALSEAESDSTRVQLTMKVVMPGGAIGRLAAGALIAPVLRKNLVLVAAGLKHYYETGTAATDADRERLAPAVTVALPSA
ncbi:SRPBCC family protein [Pseudohalioglobus sediminis]|uniref:SRPBCC family protein n=1 Tax=Pseudohalioglobus sediminis TaxID=2606449 RepID=A0A5B0WVM2_9GAMM|nr:SRPBCC family protein [Pseudohalioglobus sediminis]KAA1189929.1 SRPBCC family protein [Pseudohalioglobus sediminis]